MAEFTFDPTLSPSENIERFFEHLKKTVDVELTDLLRANVQKLLPLLPPGQDRTAARTEFNKAIAYTLDKPTTGAPGDQ